MAKVKIELNHAAVAKILKSPEVQVDLERRARSIATAAGPGHRVDSGVGRNRARAVVVTDTPEAMRAEATERRLTKSLDAGR